METTDPPGEEETDREDAGRTEALKRYCGKETFIILTLNHKLGFNCYLKFSTDLSVLLLLVPSRFIWFFLCLTYLFF